jgi:hypothetical protein
MSVGCILFEKAMPQLMAGWKAMDGTCSPSM